MDIDEALRELGVDADPGDETVRRAYLRQLKTRKPETDPEGFARLREAYETVLAIREGRAAPRTRAEPLASPVRTAESSGASETDADPEDVLERFRAEFRALPADAPPEAPVEVALRAVEALPDEEEPWRWLTSALIAGRKLPEAVAAYRAAYRQGHLVFLRELVENFPLELVDEDLLVLAREAPVHFLWSLAEQLLEMGAPVPAARCSLHALGRTEGRLPTLPLPTIWFAKLVLGLHAQSRPDLAVEVTRHCWAWLQVKVIAEDIGHPETASLWRSAEQLNALPVGFSPDLRILLANAALGDDLDSVREAYQHLLAQAPEKTREAADIVSRQTPDLSSLLGLPTRPLNESDAYWSRVLTFQLVKGLLLVVFILLPVVLTSYCSHRRTVASPSTREPPVVTEARRVAEAFCLQFPEEQRSFRCFQLHQMVDQATTKQCSRTHSEWAAVQSQLATWAAARNPRADPKVAAELERMKSHQEAFDRSLGRLCPP
ncbi:hypothetical protein D7Y21_09355 [Corallococcus sp. AB045]|uniref:hypothetical protein n=1 Tax=Corallococcus sp. AB045 TaxID=2316719 RepID=UPI000ED6813B|nr:hypothetical protein [Corallococcus sp. AB045]RKH89792.1 hypothetical protein D7Y21_09355 [Corallococcus sp. AB045]